MRKVLAGALVLALIGIPPTPAKANWQYTTWGMTPDDVVAASGGAARHRTDEGRHDRWRLELVSASYSADGFDFDVAFLFGREDRRLQCVSLRLLDDSHLDRLEARLREIYGRPANIEMVGPPDMRLIRRTIWTAENHVDLLVFLRTKGVFLRYCDRRSRGL